METFARSNKNIDLDDFALNETNRVNFAPIKIDNNNVFSYNAVNNTHTVLTPLSEQASEEHSRLTMAILGIIYTLIFLVGITGNSLVVYVVCRKKSMQSVTNLFIMNLALSDILMCLLAVPFTPISFFQEHWILGKFLCHLIPFSLGISVYVSTLTSLAIAIDRYFVIVHPFKPRMKLGVCILLIGVVWIVSISISLPLAIYMELKADDEIKRESVNKFKCQESWPIPMSKRFFNLASLVLQYLIPFTVITYSYTKVWIILSKRTRPGKTKEKEQIELKRKKKTNRMLVAMVIIFAGCWMPLNCVHLIMEFKPKFTKTENFSNIFFIAHVIAMSSTIYNPFLYAWLNENFRKEFRLVIPWIFSIIKFCRGFRRLKPTSSQKNCEVASSVFVNSLKNHSDKKNNNSSLSNKINNNKNNNQHEETDNEDQQENLKLMPRSSSFSNHTTVGDLCEGKKAATGDRDDQINNQSQNNSNNNINFTKENVELLNNNEALQKKHQKQSQTTNKQLENQQSTATTTKKIKDENNKENDLNNEHVST